MKSSKCQHLYKSNFIVKFNNWKCWINNLNNHLVMKNKYLFLQVWEGNTWLQNNSMLTYMITSSACKWEGRFSGVDTPPHWSCFAVFQIRSKESKWEKIIQSFLGDQHKEVSEQKKSKTYRPTCIFQEFRTDLTFGWIKTPQNSLLKVKVSLTWTTSYPRSLRCRCLMASFPSSCLLFVVNLFCPSIQRAIL